MEAARVLLDIDTYSKVERDPEVARDARRQLNVDTSPECVKLGKSGGFELVRSNYDLGLLQALVRELRVPLCGVPLQRFERLLRIHQRRRSA